MTRFPVRWLPYAAIFAAGVVVGLLPLDVIVWNNDWGILLNHVQNKTAAEIFSGTLEGYQYRPVHYVLAKGLFGIFGLDPLPHRLFNALLLGLYGVLVLAFHLQLCPAKKVNAHLSVLFFLLSSPVWAVLWHGTDPELIAGPLFYAVLLLFVRLGGAGNLRLLSLFVPLVALAMFTKETNRGFLPPLLLVCAYVALRKREFSRHQGFALAAAAAATVLSLLPHSRWGGSSTGPFDLSLTASLYLAVSQLMALVFFSGALALFVHSLSPYTKKEGLAGIPLLAVMLSSPVVLFFNGGEMLLFAQDAVPFTLLFSALLIAALALLARRGEETARLYALLLLAAVAAKVAGPTVLGGVRADTSTRHYLVLFPLLSWLVVDAFLGLWRRVRAADAGSPASKINRASLAAVLLSALVLFPYHTAASSYDVAQEWGAWSEAEYDGKTHLASLPLDGARILHLAFPPISREELSVLAGAPVDRTEIVWNPNAFNIPHSGEATYFYLARFRPVSNASCERLGARFPASVYGNVGDFAEMYQGAYYGCKPAEIESYLDANAARIFETRRRFVLVPRWLEDLPARLAGGIPLAMEHEYIVTIYRL